MTNHETWQVPNAAADVYERDFVPALFGAWAPRLADAAALAPGNRVLDVGCGTGVAAREAARRVGAAGHVIGLDLNEGMLAVARRLAPDIEWRIGDALGLPFEDESFDAVLSQFVLMFVPDRVAALREMWRVLVPRGRLALAVWVSIDRISPFRDFVTILRRRMGDSAAAVLEAPFLLGDERRLIGLLQEAGVENPRLETLQGWARYPSLEDFVRIEVQATPLADVMSDADYRTVLADARNRLASFDSVDEGFRFALEAHVVVAERS
jgi:ubiquinone/menaquinone biosynthesis C-methylase UbiE